MLSAVIFFRSKDNDVFLKGKLKRVTYDLDLKVFAHYNVPIETSAMIVS